MLQNAPRRVLSPLLTDTRALSCLLCQWRAFTTSYRRLDDAPPPPRGPAQAPRPAVPAKPARSAPLADAPRSYGKPVGEFTPKPLVRPIGMPPPPLPGENSGEDQRSLRERRDDFVDYQKHLKRREELYVSNKL